MSRGSLFALALLATACIPAVIAAAQLTSDTTHPPGFFHSLSPQQKMMMFVDLRKETAGMTDDQKRAYRQSQRQKLAAMTNPEKEQFAAKLQSEWDSLPEDQRASIKQQVMAWRARHASSSGQEGNAAQ